MMKIRFRMPGLMLALMLALILVPVAGCVPTVQRQWDVQPLDGTIVDAETGLPVAGATVTSVDDPTLTATTSQDGYFMIEEKSHVGVHMAMPASYLKGQNWRLSHPDYADGLAQTRYFIPALSRQPTTLTLALFKKLPESPQDCPDFGYMLALGQWYAANGIEVEYIETGICRNRAAIEQLQNAW